MDIEKELEILACLSDEEIEDYPEKTTTRVHRHIRECKVCKAIIKAEEGTPEEFASLTDNELSWEKFQEREQQGFFKGRKIEHYFLNELVSKDKGEERYRVTTPDDREYFITLFIGCYSEAEIYKFYKEAEFIKNLNYPFCEKIITFNEYRGNPYYVSEIVQGQTLEERRNDISEEEEFLFLEKIREIETLKKSVDINYKKASPKNAIVVGKGENLSVIFINVYMFQSLTPENIVSKNDDVALLADITNFLSMQNRFDPFSNESKNKDKSIIAGNDISECVLSFSIYNFPNFGTHLFKYPSKLSALSHEKIPEPGYTQIIKLKPHKKIPHLFSMAIDQKGFIILGVREPQNIQEDILVRVKEIEEDPRFAWISYLDDPNWLEGASSLIWQIYKVQGASIQRNDRGDILPFSALSDVQFFGELKLQVRIPLLEKITPSHPFVKWSTRINGIQFIESLPKEKPENELIYTYLYHVAYHIGVPVSIYHPFTNEAKRSILKYEWLPKRLRDKVQKDLE